MPTFQAKPDAGSENTAQVEAAKKCSEFLMIITSLSRRHWPGGTIYSLQHLEGASSASV